MVDLIEYLKYSGPSTILLFVGLIWGKGFIKYFFDETIELKKLELNHELEIYRSQLEQQNKSFQHSLDTKLNEFNIRFSSLHQERAEVIRQLYYKLVELQSSMFNLTRRAHLVINNAHKEEDERLERMNKALQDFNNYYLPNKIYFNSEITNKLNNLSKEYWDKGWDYSFISKQFKEGSIPRDLFDEYFEKSKSISNIVEKDFVKLIEELENDFRQILGVT